MHPPRKDVSSMSTLAIDDARKAFAEWGIETREAVP
jgi:hypothetical protein